MFKAIDYHKIDYKLNHPIMQRKGICFVAIMLSTIIYKLLYSSPAVRAAKVGN